MEYLSADIKQAIKDYNGRTKIKDEEIHDIKWFIRTKNLTIKEAVKAYFEDKEEEKNLSYKEYIALKRELCLEIKGHCETCPIKDRCIKNALLDTWGIGDLKRVQRSECWKNPK